MCCQLAFEVVMGRLHDDDGDDDDDDDANDDPVRGWTYHSRNKANRIFVHSLVNLKKLMHK
jgi:hypothetical protein